jgi:hypothetical protein
MAQATGTYDSYDGKGLREDLSNFIYNISPEETPFQTAVPKVSVKATKHEWQTDTLADATTDNAQIEGDEYSYADPSATTRVGNYTQIMRKTFKISGTLERVDKAGRRSELSYQGAKKAKELKRDIESIMLNNQASLAGDATTARTLGGLPAWLTSNDARSTGGSDGGYVATTGLVAAATDATTTQQRTFTETLLKSVLKSVYEAGGEPRVMMVGPFNKQTFSAFTGISDLRHDGIEGRSGQAKIQGAADFYISDYGTLKVVTNRFQRERDVFILDPKMAAIGILRPVDVHKPAKTGDAENRVLITEQTLVVRNEAAHGVIADCTTA